MILYTSGYIWDSLWTATKPAHWHSLHLSLNLTVRSRLNAIEVMQEEAWTTALSFNQNCFIFSWPLPSALQISLFGSLCIAYTFLRRELTVGYLFSWWQNGTLSHECSCLVNLQNRTKQWENFPPVISGSGKRSMEVKTTILNRNLEFMYFENIRFHSNVSVMHSCWFWFCFSPFNSMR